MKIIKNIHTQGDPTTLLSKILTQIDIDTDDIIQQDIQYKQNYISPIENTTKVDINHTYQCTMCNYILQNTVSDYILNIDTNQTSIQTAIDNINSQHNQHNTIPYQCTNCQTHNKYTKNTTIGHTGNQVYIHLVQNN